MMVLNKNTQDKIRTFESKKTKNIKNSQPEVQIYWFLNINKCSLTNYCTTRLLTLNISFVLILFFFEEQSFIDKF